VNLLVELVTVFIGDVCPICFEHGAWVLETMFGVRCTNDECPAYDHGWENAVLRMRFGLA
jgi:hypothetical protein